MSSLLRYYAEGNKTLTMADLSLARKLPFKDTYNFYLSPSPMGVTWQLDAEMIGQRPVWKAYEVGTETKLGEAFYKEPGDMCCKQPNWHYKCK